MAQSYFSSVFAQVVILACIALWPAPCRSQQNPNPPAKEPELDEAGCPRLTLFPKIVTSVVVSCQRGDSVEVIMPLKPDEQGRAREKSVRGEFEFREYQVPTDVQEHEFDNLLQLASIAGFALKSSDGNSTFTARKGDVWLLVIASGEYYDAKLVHVTEAPWTPPFRTAEQIRQEMDAGGRVAIYGIEFSPDDQAVTGRDPKILAEVLKYLSGTPGQPIVIESHKFSPNGSAPEDLAITAKRAEAFASWLEAQGIDARRLQPKSLGRTKPLTENDTPAEIQRNDRIELAKPTS